MKALNVGTTGFEPATPRPPAECSTGLSHVPMFQDFKFTGFYSILQYFFYISVCQNKNQKHFQKNVNQ